MPLRNGLTKAKSFSKRHSYNDKEKLVVQMRSSSMESNIMARGRQHDRTGKILCHYLTVDMHMQIDRKTPFGRKANTGERGGR